MSIKISEDFALNNLREIYSVNNKIPTRKDFYLLGSKVFYDYYRRNKGWEYWENQLGILSIKNILNKAKKTRRKMYFHISTRL